ncbi:MAG TPA: type II toxin-antitoxin system RelE/ParE family toxin [Rhizobiaceae bacterium]|nr:type II toxin-antitoxin system RelE/ParE family toxin [Rhizobiaceae bacterium]
MPKAITILPKAARELRRQKADAGRILDKLEQFAKNPAAFANNVKALSGSTHARLRIRDYRVIFEETADEIIVIRIGPRGSVYD